MKHHELIFVDVTQKCSLRTNLVREPRLLSAWITAEFASLERLRTACAALSTVYEPKPVKSKLGQDKIISHGMFVSVLSDTRYPPRWLSRCWCALLVGRLFNRGQGAHWEIGSLEVRPNHWVCMQELLSETRTFPVL